MTECSAQSTFSEFVLPVVVRSDAPAMSSDAGVLLLRRVDEAMDLTRPLARVLSDERDPSRVVHSRLEQLRQRVYQIALGYEDCNDSQSLRNDPLLKLACDREPADSTGLSSQPTLCRFENDLSGSAVGQLLRRLEREWLDSLDRDQELVVLDIDSTDDETHGAQQLSCFNAFFDHHAFHPLLIFDAHGQLVSAVLRAGNAHASRGARGLLRRLIRKIRKRCPRAAILVRADSAFAIPRILGELDRLDEELGSVDYLMGIARNRVLERRLAPLLGEVREAQRGTETRRRFTEFHYQAQSWKRSRQIVAKAEVTMRGPNPRFLVTSIEGFDPADVYRAYCERGQSENHLKDLKRALMADRLSCHRFAANFFRLLLHAVAYRLLFALRRMLGTVDANLATIQFDTLRLRLLKVAGTVQQSVRRVLVQLPKSFPWAPVFHRLCQASALAAPAPG